MKLTALILLAITAAGSAAYARNKAALDGPKVSVCAEMPTADTELGMAKIMASGLFARIGVELEWRRAGCPSGAVRISVSTATPSKLHPGALAYATPYDGTHIVVFWDRVEAMMRKGERSTLLAYVEAHEITHILEGVSRHSTSGLMKAHWDERDYKKMEGGDLTFAPEDVELIYQGLAQRQRLAARSEGPGYHGEAEQAEVSK